MYDYVMLEWEMSAFSVVQINLCVTKNWITQAQANVILATPQS